MNSHKKNILDTRIIIALFIIIAGVALLMENMGFINNIHIWEWWPVILIAMGVGQLLNSGRTGQSVGGFILLFIGLVFLGNNLDIFFLEWSVIWPVFLIILGLLILKKHTLKSAPSAESGDFLNLSVILGGGEHNIENKHLKGGRLSAIMGGVEVDLSNSEMEGNEIVFNVFSFMAGIEIRVPRHWQVDIRAMPFLGGFENKTRSSIHKNDGFDVPQSAKVLTIEGLAFLGGVEIKN